MKKSLIVFSIILLIFAASLGCDEDDENDPAALNPPEDDDDDDDFIPPNDDDDDTSIDDDDDDDAADDDDDDTADCWDADEDGFKDELCGGEDCDDTLSNVNPDEFDTCGDKLDNDCDGIIDNPDEQHVELDEFVFGISSSSGNLMQHLADLSIPYYRTNIAWREVMPEITEPFITMADVDQQAVDDLIDNTDWSNIDAEHADFLANGITPVPIVGHGFTSNHSDFDGDRASPYRIGKAPYLAYMYLYVRAVVERYDGDGYKDAPGIVIKFWQIENELNQALLTTVWGWRHPEWLEGLLSPWASWRFCTDVLKTLNDAVHDSDPQAITTSNLHTDIHPDLSALIFQPSWIEAATLWRDHMDLIGFDAYVNYYIADPVMGYKVGERVEILKEAACGKPVIAMEVGCPSGPAELGFDQTKQAQYIYDAINTSIDAGVVGYFQFGLESRDSHSVQITAEDIYNMQLIAPMFTTGEALPLFIWALGNADYINDHFLDVVKAVEGYWGIVDDTGTQKPSYAVVQGAVIDIYGP